jgi:hypothetical protein
MVTIGGTSATKAPWQGKKSVLDKNRTTADLFALSTPLSRCNHLPDHIMDPCYTSPNLPLSSSCIHNAAFVPSLSPLASRFTTTHLRRKVNDQTDIVNPMTASKIYFLSPFTALNTPKPVPQVLLDNQWINSPLGSPLAFHGEPSLGSHSNTSSVYLSNSSQRVLGEVDAVLCELKKLLVSFVPPTVSMSGLSITDLEKDSFEKENLILLSEFKYYLLLFFRDAIVERKNAIKSRKKDLAGKDDVVGSGEPTSNSVVSSTFEISLIKGYCDALLECIDDIERSEVYANYIASSPDFERRIVGKTYDCIFDDNGDFIEHDDVNKNITDQGEIVQTFSSSSLKLITSVKGQIFHHRNTSFQTLINKIEQVDSLKRQISINYSEATVSHPIPSIFTTEIFTPLKPRCAASPSFISSPLNCNSLSRTSSNSSIPVGRLLSRSPSNEIINTYNNNVSSQINFGEADLFHNDLFLSKHSTVMNANNGYNTTPYLTPSDVLSLFIPSTYISRVWRCVMVWLVEKLSNRSNTVTEMLPMKMEGITVGTSTVSLLSPLSIGIHNKPPPSSSPIYNNNNLPHMLPICIHVERFIQYCVQKVESPSIVTLLKQLQLKNSIVGRYDNLLGREIISKKESCGAGMTFPKYIHACYLSRSMKAQLGKMNVPPVSSSPISSLTLTRNISNHGNSMNNNLVLVETRDYGLNRKKKGEKIEENIDAEDVNASPLFGNDYNGLYYHKPSLLSSEDSVSTYASQQEFLVGEIFNEYIYIENLENKVMSENRIKEVKYDIDMLANEWGEDILDECLKEMEFYRI